MPGYTDGTCSLDNQRYFQCTDGHGYYVLQNNFFNTHRIIEKKKDTKKLTTTSDENFDFDRQSTICSQPIQSKYSPSIAEKHSNINNDNHGTSSSRGILSRLTGKQQSPSSLSTEQTSSIETHLQPSRVYHPDNYQSVSCDQTHKSIIATVNPDKENQTSALYNRTPSTPEAPSSEQVHNLDGWTLARLNDFLQKQIPQDNHFCLNIYEDDCEVMNLIDEQINGCASVLPTQSLDNIQIELLKLFDHVDVILPSRTIRLYEGDYVLLAIICSNNQCAYIRTSNGWSYTDTEQSIIVNEISQMIDQSNKDLLKHSEQCRHLTKNASFLYYKRI